MVNYNIIEVDGLYKVQYPKKVVRRSGIVRGQMSTVYIEETTLGSYTTIAAAEKILNKIKANAT